MLSKSDSFRVTQSKAHPWHKSEGHASLHWPEIITIGDLETLGNTSGKTVVRLAIKTLAFLENS